MDLLQRIRTRGLVFDGAMGSMLIMEGLADGRVSEIRTLENPAVVEKIHRAYFAAGADVVTTNTFGGSPLKLKKAGLADRCEEINRRAVRLARRAAGAGGLVAADVGPCGSMLAPFGDVDPVEAQAGFRRQAAYLAAEGPDLFVVETMFDLAESLAALRGIREASGLPVFATLTFQSMPKGFATLMGNRVAAGMQALVDAGAMAVGANCSMGSDAMVALAADIRAATEAPVMIQPNAGMPAAKGSEVFYPEDEATFAANLRAIRELGVEIVGGCCGSTPDYIRRVVSEIRPPSSMPPNAQ